MTELPPNQKHLIEHSLGVDYRPKKFKPYRNHYVASPGHDCLPDLRALESAGLMISRPAPAFCHADDIVFYVTEAGAKAAGRKLPRKD